MIVKRNQNFPITHTKIYFLPILIHWHFDRFIICSADDKKALYEKGLKTAWVTANLFEDMLPVDQQVLPDLTVTEILFVPPYKKYVKMVHTAMENTPVGIN